MASVYRPAWRRALRPATWWLLMHMAASAYVSLVGRRMDDISAIDSAQA